jgi:putative addiction module component (TIGR02574 family)
MTSKALRKKVIEYINHAEDNVIEAVYGMLKIYEDSDGKSLMTSEQKSEIERRSALYRQGKLKTTSWNELKKRTRSNKD